MPDIDILTKFAVFLHDYGGWAFSIIMLVAIFYLHRTTSGLLEKRNGEIKALLAECKSVIAENRVFLDRVEDAMDNSEVTIKENTSVLVRVRVFLEDLRR